jgi:hypothetical protein
MEEIKITVSGLDFNAGKVEYIADRVKYYLPRIGSDKRDYAVLQDIQNMREDINELRVSGKFLDVANQAEKFLEDNESRLVTFHFLSEAAGLMRAASEQTVTKNKVANAERALWKLQNGMAHANSDKHELQTRVDEIERFIIDAKIKEHMSRADKHFSAQKQKIAVRALKEAAVLILAQKIIDHAHSDLLSKINMMIDDAEGIIESTAHQKRLSKPSH